MVKNLSTFDDKRLHFGFSLALNTLDFNISHYPSMDKNPQFNPLPGSSDLQYQNAMIRGEIANLTPGFTVGIVSNLRLGEYLDLRFLPGMSFCERKLVYNIPIVDANNLANTEFFSIKSTFLDFPLLLKYKAKRMNNQRPYIIGGLAYRIDISKTALEDLVRLKPFSSSVEAGMGWDMYLQFFRLSTEFKFSFGLDNILDSGPKANQMQVFSSAFSRLSSNMFIFSFHFE